MSKIFESNNPAVSRHLTVSSDHAGLFFAVGGTGIFIDPDKAAEIALAAFEEAGVEPKRQFDATYGDAGHLARIAHELTAYVKHHERKAAHAAEEAAALEKLTKRRGELAVEYFEGAYDHLPRAAYQRAIDRIIELEDKAQS